MVKTWMLVVVGVTASCRSLTPAGVATIERIGLIDCYRPGAVDGHGRPLSCETSAVELIGDRLLIASDKDTPDGMPSPFMWIPLTSRWPEELDETLVQHETNAVLRSARKVEGLTVSSEGDLVFATTDFDWPPDTASTEPDAYNTLIYWPVSDMAAARVAHPTSNGGVTSSISLRPHFMAALRSEKYPSGPPYFKIEGLAALPNRVLLFGVREIGEDYEHPEYTFAFLEVSYTVSPSGEVTLSLPFKATQQIDAAQSLGVVNRTGLSSIAVQGNRIWFLGSREAAEGQTGHESSLWLADIRNVRKARRVTVPDGSPLILPCKAEGLAMLPSARLFVVCDEDRSLSTFTLPDGRTIGRRAGQGVYVLIRIVRDAA